MYNKLVQRSWKVFWLATFIWLSITNTYTQLIDNWERLKNNSEWNCSNLLASGIYQLLKCHFAYATSAMEFAAIFLTTFDNSSLDVYNTNYIPKAKKWKSAVIYSKKFQERESFKKGKLCSAQYFESRVK